MLSRLEHAAITAQMKKLGCSARQAEVYLQCLQQGPASVLEIARALRQNRVTVHDTVRQLLEKGLLHETRRKKRRMVVPEGPDALERLLQTRRNELDVLGINLKSLSELLRQVHSPTRTRPGIEFFEGADGFKQVLERTLAARGEFLAIINVEMFSELLSPAYLENFFARRAAKGIHSRLIWPVGRFAKRMIDRSREHKIQVRLLPGFEWRSGIISWNDCLSIKSFSRGGITCTIIQNEDIAHFFRNVIFELIWRAAGGFARMP